MAEFGPRPTGLEVHLTREPASNDPAGIIGCDDYGFYSCSGITQFVNEERMKRDRLLIQSLNGDAIVIKMGGDRPFSSRGGN